MHIVVIAASEFEFEGRLREMYAIARQLGDASLISRSVTGRPVDDRHTIFKSSGPFWYISFIFFCLRRRRSDRQIDVIIASNRKALLPAYLLSLRHRRAVTVYDALELYILGEIDYLTGKIGCIVEKLLVRKFDIVICANRERAEIMKRIYRLRDDPVVFENVRRLGGDAPAAQGECPAEYAFLQQYKWVLLSTAGCLLDRRSDELVRAVAKAGPDYAVVLVGSSTQEERDAIRSAMAENSCRNAYIYDAMQPDALVTLMRQCNIGVVCYGDMDTNNRYCASGKIYEFIFEGLPVLCTANPPLASFCSEHGVGVACETFEEGLARIVADFDVYRAATEAFSRRYSPETYRASVASLLLERIEDLRR